MEQFPVLISLQQLQNLGWCTQSHGHHEWGTSASLVQKMQNCSLKEVCNSENVLKTITSKSGSNNRFSHSGASEELLNTIFQTHSNVNALQPVQIGRQTVGSAFLL